MEDYKVAEMELRKELVEEYGEDNVWDTEEATEDFEFLSFLAPYVAVIRKSDNQKGTLAFTGMPRLYYNFKF